MGSLDERKVAIVTGATSGMGIDIARHLYTLNYRVALVGRKPEAGHRLADELDASRAAVDFFQTELQSYASQSALFRAVWQKWQRIDLLAANAGIVDLSSVYIYNHRGQSVADLPPEPDLTCTDIDYKGVVYGTVLATHFMRHNPTTPGGKIIVTGSIGAVFPHRSYPEYCGAKAAVLQFVRAVAPLLKQKENITINCVLPGAVDTPIVPPEMIKAVSPECLTSIATVIKAYDEFLHDESNTKTGQAVEASADQIFYYDLPEMANGYKTKRAVTVWEPLFRAMHGEDSGLEEAIP